MARNKIAEIVKIMTYGIGYTLCLPFTVVLCFVGKLDAKRISRSRREQNRRTELRRAEARAGKPSAFSDAGNRRPLTPMQNDEPVQQQNKINPQTQALLLQLPAEIRRMIWLTHLGDRLIHLWPQKEYEWTAEDWHPKVYHRICQADCLAIKEDGHGSYMSSDPSEPTAIMRHVHIEDWEHRIGQINKKTTDLLALARTCRRIYFETLPLLYTSNTFILSSSTVDSITPWSKGRFNLITRLRIGFWLYQPPEDPEWSYAWHINWRTIASLPALQQLVAHIGCSPHGASWLADNEKTIFAEIKPVTQPKDFVLVLNWMKRQENETLWKEMPCRIVHQWTWPVEEDGSSSSTSEIDV